MQANLSSLISTNANVINAATYDKKELTAQWLEPKEDSIKYFWQEFNVEICSVGQVINPCLIASDFTDKSYLVE